MPNTDRLINHQDGLKIVTQLEEIASALGHSNKVTGVKGNSEINYRTGNVNISPSDLGLGHVQEDIDALANEKADVATTLAGYGITDSYTKLEVDNIVSEIETNIVWKAAVADYSDITTTYPNPEEGWTVNVTNTNETYRYDGSEWVMINANSIPEATTSISGLMTSAHVTKLNSIEEGAEVNVQADWNQTNSSHDGFIKNKPSIPSKTSELVNDSNFITNENLSTVAMTGEFSDLQDIPTTISGYGISDAYTKDEVDNIVSTIETSVTWKEAVINYSDIATTYPNPEEGWTVNVTSTNSTYRYNGTEWVLINTNMIPNATTSVNGLMTTTHVGKLNSIETSAQKNVQADWNENDYVNDSYIKNKPTLGTASAKDAPTSGDATNTQVVLGSDSRLSDARPASDVSAWAKAETKPTYTATEVGAIASTEKGTASGVAELDANGKVPSSQLPSFVDDVKEGYLNSADGKFYEESTYETEITPEADKIYVDKATNITYRWSGSAFVPIGSDLALGETSTTAYRGDRGKAAYDHATDANKISTATASGLYKMAATAEGHISDLTAVQKSDLTALGVADASNLGTAAAKDSTSTITSGSTDLIEGGAVYTALQGKADSADLGTAASKDVATSGDASASQVVMGNDSRLTDARNAADVSAWAKAATKPTYTASEVGAIASTLKGANNGVAELDANGKVPSGQLPSYVDDVLEYASQSAFPATGETGKIYIAQDTNKTYRWSGSAYAEISASLALGETSSTAYRGDRGKAAYDHSQLTGSNPHGVTKSDVGLGNVGNFKAVSTVASQGLSDTEKSNARTNIGAGTSSFSGAYNDLTGKPTLGTAAAKNVTASVTSGSADVVTSGAVYTYVDTVITQALNGSY